MGLTFFKPADLSKHALRVAVLAMNMASATGDNDDKSIGTDMAILAGACASVCLFVLCLGCVCRYAMARDAARDRDEQLNEPEYTRVFNAV